MSQRLTDQWRDSSSPFERKCEKMTDEFKNWFFEELLYSPRLQLPKHLGSEYLDLRRELDYLDHLKHSISKLPVVEKQKIELREKLEAVENQLTEYFKTQLPRVLTLKYLSYLQDSYKDC